MNDRVQPPPGPPPNEVEVEEALLGAVLAGLTPLAELRARLRPADLFGDCCRHIYQAMVDVDDAGQRVTLTRLFDSRSLTPGEYQIQVRLHDRVTGDTITPTTKFTVAQLVP